MASTRAAQVAEVLWELKRANKVAVYTAVANRAGFSAGSGGRTMKTCLKTVRRDWPHLQWWRAIPDDMTVKHKGEQAAFLKEIGIDVAEKAKEGRVSVSIDEEMIMVWTEEEAEKAAVEEGS